MGALGADLRATLYETRSRPGCRVGGLPSGRLAAQCRHAADALFCADRHVRTAVRQKCGCRNDSRDDAALRGGGLGHLDPVVSRLGVARTALWTRLTDPFNQSVMPMWCRGCRWLMPS